MFVFFFFQAEDGIRDKLVTGVQTCALPIAIAKRVICRDAQGCRLPLAAEYSIAKPMPEIAAIRITRPHWMPRSLSAKLNRRWPISTERLAIAQPRRGSERVGGGADCVAGAFS